MTILPHEKQIHEYVKTIDRLKKQSKGQEIFDQEIHDLESKLVKLKETVYSSLSPWERISICRHPKRPHSIDYLHHMCDRFTELCGDRHFGDDRALIGGLGHIGPMKCMIFGQEKGHDTDSRLHHNFGMMRPEGYRKALRLMRLAEKFQLPVVSLIDTAGAYAVLEAEERGIAWAIADNLKAMANLKTPIIVVVVGEACSGGAIGVGVGDSVAMLEHACYSVIAPESCASILYKDPSKKALAAASLRLNAEDNLEHEVIDMIIEEPMGGAHHDAEATLQTVRRHILEQWTELKNVPLETLLERRYHKFRRMGVFKHGGQ